MVTRYIGENAIKTIPSSISFDVMKRQKSALSIQFFNSQFTGNTSFELSLLSSFFIRKEKKSAYIPETSVNMKIIRSVNGTKYHQNSIPFIQLLLFLHPFFNIITSRLSYFKTSKSFQKSAQPSFCCLFNILQK